MKLLTTLLLIMSLVGAYDIQDLFLNRWNTADSKDSHRQLKKAPGHKKIDGLKSHTGSQSDMDEAEEENRRTQAGNVKFIFNQQQKDALTKAQLEEEKKNIFEKISSKLHLGQINQSLNDTLLQNKVSKTFKIDAIADGTVTVTKGAVQMTVGIVDGVATVLGVHKIAQVVGLEKIDSTQNFGTRQNSKFSWTKVFMGLTFLSALGAGGFFGWKHYSKSQRSSHTEMTEAGIDMEAVSQPNTSQREPHTSQRERQFSPVSGNHHKSIFSGTANQDAFSTQGGLSSVAPQIKGIGHSRGNSTINNDITRFQQEGGTTDISYAH